jgi:hypothetical protein
MEHEPAVAPVVATLATRVTTWTAREGMLWIRVTDLEEDRYLVEVMKGYQGRVDRDWII